MADEEIKQNPSVTPPEGDQNDKGGEDKKETTPTEEKKDGDSEDFNEDELIDPEIKDYKPTPPAEEDDDTDPEDKARIEKIVDKKIGGQITEIQRKAELDAFVSQNPEYAKYRNVIDTYKKHPDYSKVPLKNIAAMVTARDQQKIGAAKERDAAKKAAETKVPGGTNPPTDSQVKNWHEAPKEDFEAQRAKVLGRLGQ